MSMYIMKPYYKTKGGRATTTTTYRTLVYRGTAFSSGSDWSYSSLYNYLSSLPSITISKQSTRIGRYYSGMSLSYSLPLPEALFTLGNFDTSRSIFTQNNMKSTLIKLSAEPNKFFSYSSNSFAAGLSTLTYNKNNKLAYFSYAGRCSYADISSLKDIMTFWNSADTYTYQGISVGSINDSYNIYKMETTRFGTYCAMTKMYPVCFQVTDPTKVTVIWDNYFMQTSTSVLSSMDVTMYEATLSELYV